MIVNMVEAIDFALHTLSSRHLCSDPISLGEKSTNVIELVSRKSRIETPQRPKSNTSSTSIVVNFCKFMRNPHYNYVVDIFDPNVTDHELYNGRESLP